MFEPQLGCIAVSSVLLATFLVGQENATFFVGQENATIG